jgi:hypothetical protein
MKAARHVVHPGLNHPAASSGSGRRIRVPPCHRRGRIFPAENND